MVGPQDKRSFQRMERGGPDLIQSRSYGKYKPSLTNLVSSDCRRTSRRAGQQRLMCLWPAPEAFDLREVLIASAHPEHVATSVQVSMLMAKKRMRNCVHDIWFEHNRQKWVGNGYSRRFGLQFRC